MKLSSVLAAKTGLNARTPEHVMRKPRKQHSILLTQTANFFIVYPLPEYSLIDKASMAAILSPHTDDCGYQCADEAEAIRRSLLLKTGIAGI